MAQFCPFGYRDIETCIENGEQAGLYEDEIAQMIIEWCEGSETPIAQCDPVAILFDVLQQEARTEIEKQTGKDISNDKPYSEVYVVGNYMCTSFGGSDEAREATKKLIDTMTDRNEVVSWYYDKMN